MADVISNKVADVTTTKLESETRKELWKTSTQPIKNYKSVNYGGEHLMDDIVDKDGDIGYIEHPVQGAAANVILKKKDKTPLKDFISIDNPMKGSS